MDADVILSEFDSPRAVAGQTLSKSPFACMMILWTR